MKTSRLIKVNTLCTVSQYIELVSDVSIRNETPDSYMLHGNVWLTRNRLLKAMALNQPNQFCINFETYALPEDREEAIKVNTEAIRLALVQIKKDLDKTMSVFIHRKGKLGR